MKLTDILTVDEWAALETELNEKYGLNMSLFDADGVRVTSFIKWANKLCPVIKANPDGASYICAMAHQEVAAEAMRTKEPVISECDAGFVKVGTPVFVGDEFLGIFGGCGYLLDDGEVDSFLVMKTIGNSEEEIEDLAKGTKSMSTEEAEDLAAYLKKRIADILDKHKK